VEEEGWRFVAFVRLVPLFPFNVLNYALGLTRIRLSHYFFASFLFMLPGAFAYTWLGYAGREALAGGEGLIQKGLLALGLLALVAFLPRLVNRLRRGSGYSVGTLQQAMENDRHLLVLDVRDEAHFFSDQGHIGGAINIPLEELATRSGELAEYAKQPIAVIDSGKGEETEKAVKLLVAQGYSHIHPVTGGMASWREAGYPVVR
jgi:rhodanese-related sulfurtransferase